MNTRAILFSLILLCAAASFAGSLEVYPEIYSGILLVGENKIHSSLGLELGCGARISRRHLVGYEINISKQLGGVTDVPEPTNDIVTGASFIYSFMPVNISDRLKWDIGMRNGVNRNEYDETDGYIGFSSRAMAGGKKAPGMFRAFFRWRV